MEKRGPSFSPPPASPTQFRYGNHSVGVGGGYAPSPKEEKLLDLEEAAKAKVQQAELLYNKAIQAAKIAIESRTGVTGGSSGSGSHINMSSSPREDYEKRKAFMKPEQLTLDIASLSSYRKLIETVNSIEEEPFAASPLKERKQPAAAAEEEEQGWVNKNTNKDGQGQKNLKGKDVIDSSTTSVVKKAASKPVTLLQLKIQKIIGKKSLEDAEQKERQIEIDSLHSRLDTLELTRVKGDTDAVDALLLSQKEEVEEEEERVIIKPLSPESNEHYRRIMSTSHNDVICQHKSLRLSVSDMHSLGPGQWLTDENINFYMALLNDRAQRRIKEGRGPACYFTNTFFFNKLYKNSRRYEYKGVRKWTKKVKIGVSTAECDKIIVPIHQQVHWCCAVVDIKRKELVYYDSMLGRDESVLESLAQWVQDEMKDKADLTIDTSTWERRYPGNIPQQENGYDCGVFAVKFAEYSGLDAPLDFSQKNMSHFRKEMVVQLSKVNLDYEE
jgi:Ulp1 family protease